MSFRIQRVEQPMERPRDVRHELRLAVRGLDLAAVGHTPERYEALEIRMQIESVSLPCVLQIDHRQDMQQLIDGLVELRDVIWPQGGG